jgi:hypothetical protein
VPPPGGRAGPVTRSVSTALMVTAIWLFG